MGSIGRAERLLPLVRAERGPAARGTCVAVRGSVIDLPSERAVSRASDQPASSRSGLLVHELASALRGLVRSPRYSLPALLSLALGIGACTAVFSAFSAMLLRPLPFAHEDELVQVGLQGGTGWSQGLANTMSPAFAEDYRKLDTLFESLSVLRFTGGRMTGAADAQQVALLQTSLDFFDTLGTSPEQGRTYTAKGNAPDGFEGVVLRHGFWITAFGGEPVVGKTVLVDDVPKTVLGILPDDQAIPSWGMMWMPEPTPQVESRFWLMINLAVGRLKPGMPLELARERLHALSAAQGVRDDAGSLITGTITPLRETFVGEQRGLISLMFAAVLTFLLLACANVAALLATRASVRRHEYALRAALGASRVSLARQSVFEGLILVVLGGAVALWPATLFMSYVNEEYLDLLGNTPARLDWLVLVAFAGLLLLAAAVAALAPALYTRRVQPMDALRGEGRSSASRRARRARELLVALQIAATLALLVNAGLLVRSVRTLLAVDKGIDPEGVVIGSVMARTAPRGEGRDGFRAQRDEAERAARRVLERTHSLPGVTAACVATDVPFDFNDNIEMFEGEGGARGAVLAHPHWIGPGCFTTFGTRLLSGRDFSLDAGADQSDSGEGIPVAIVNRAFARQVLGVEDAVGRRLRFAMPPDLQQHESPPWIPIVGMSEDALEMDLSKVAEPAVYLPFLVNPLRFSSSTSVSFRVAAKAQGGTEPLLATLPRALGTVLSESPVYDFGSLNDYIEHTFRQRRALERVLSAFGVSALLLGAIGLFGVTAYSVAERTSELGIRRALGASRGAILRLVLRETGAVIALGMLFGLMLSQLARDVLQGFLFGVSPNDPLTHALVCLGIPLVALLAAIGPARAAAAISPSRALTGR
jgi:predicted permease